MKHLINTNRQMEMLKAKTGLTAGGIRVLLVLYYKRQPMVAKEIAEEIDFTKEWVVDAVITKLRVKGFITRHNPIEFTEPGLNKVSEILEAYKAIAKALKL